MISISINVVKIDKTKLVDGKNGAKYLNAILIETPNDKYGNDYLVAESVSKADRDAGKLGAIIGNAKIIGKGKPNRPAGNEADDSGVPF